MSPFNFEQHLKSTVLDIDAFGFDRNSGLGLIDTQANVVNLNTPIFADGFESGNTTAWTSQVP